MLLVRHDFHASADSQKAVPFLTIPQFGKDGRGCRYPLRGCDAVLGARRCLILGQINGFLVPRYTRSPEKQALSPISAVE